MANIQETGGKHIDRMIETGEFYCNDTCDGFPKGYSAGLLTVTKVLDADGAIVLILQVFKGLHDYGDTTLTTVERFEFVKEQWIGHFEASHNWTTLKPSLITQ